MSSNSSSEKRAVFTFSLIFVAFCLTGLPISLFQIVRSLNLSLWCKTPHMIHFVVVQLFLSSTGLDPFLVMRDRDLRKRLKHLLCCHNNCDKYYHERSNIHFEIPPSRDLDTIRNIAVRALNIFSGPLQNEGGSRNASKLDQLSHSHRHRTGSAPPACYGGMQRHSLGPKFPVGIKEKVSEEEEEGVGSQISKNSTVKIIDSDLGRQEIEVEVEFHDEIKCEVVYSDSNKESIQVSIKFGE